MSEIVNYRGKLTKMDKLPNETLEQQCKRILEAIEASVCILNNEYYKSYAELLITEYSRKYIIQNNELYMILYKKINIEDDVFVVIPTESGYVFELKYNNGVYGFQEAIEEAFYRLKKEGKNICKIQIHK